MKLSNYEDKDTNIFTILRLITFFEQLNLTFLAKHLAFKINLSTFASGRPYYADILVKKIYFLIIIVLALCFSCQMKFQADEDADTPLVKVERYDRLEYRYLTTADYSALQEMNTEYPMETRTLLEDVLQLGEATDPDINNKFINFYQDPRLQSLMTDAETQYANMDSLNAQFNMAFAYLKKVLPELKIPRVYAQLSALDQSVIVGDQTIGISLDKYLGANYPLYKTYYSAEQRKVMTHEYIVPDCIVFYLMSQYPLKGFEQRSQTDRDMHVARVQWVANRAIGQKVFSSDNIDLVNHYMKKNPKTSIDDLLRMNNFSPLLGK